MFKESVLIAGYGGQGILFAARILAQSALEANFNVTFFPSYGAEIRGGTANCTVIISDEEIGSPIVLKWDNLIFLNKPSLDRFSKSGKSESLFLLNQSLIKGNSELSGSNVVSMPLSELSNSNFDDTRFTNIVALGVFLKHKNIFPLEVAEKVLDKALKGKGNLGELNKRALSLGAVQV
ncbi:MAG: 2-oxoacid:acceptor oxidoreductase family protein [bacterium]